MKSHAALVKPQQDAQQPEFSPPGRQCGNNSTVDAGVNLDIVQTRLSVQSSAVQIQYYVNASEPFCVCVVMSALAMIVVRVGLCGCAARAHLHCVCSRSTRAPPYIRRWCCGPHVRFARMHWAPYLGAAYGGV